MAQVKFIQLGTTGNEIPWADYNGKVDNPKSLAKAKQDYPGAIIFATYFNESNEKTQSIYANGEEYSVGGGGGGTVYVGTKTVKNGTLDTSGKVYKDGFSGTEKLDTTFKPGDIYIYKKSETASSLESSGYVYVKKDDGGQWEALAGAVSAENVWFYNGVQRTCEFGEQPAPEAGVAYDKKDTPTTLKDFLEFYTCKAVSDTGTYTQSSTPTYTASYQTAPVTKNQEFQINSTQTKTFTWTPTFKTSVNSVDTVNKTYQNTITCTNKKNYGYFKGTETIEGRTVSTSSDKVNYTESTPSGATIQLKIGTTTGTSVTYTSASTNCNIIYTVPTTTLGANLSYTIKYAESYLKNCKLTWKNNGVEVTSVTVPQFSDVYFKTNLSGKGNAVMYPTSTLKQTVTLPTTVSPSSVSDTQVSYKVYQRVLWMKRESMNTTEYTPVAESASSKQRYYGENIMVSFEINYAHSKTNDLSYFYIPKAATVEKVELGGQSADYTVDANDAAVKYTFEGVENQYKKLKLVSSCSANTVLQITLN